MNLVKLDIMKALSTLLMATAPYEYDGETLSVSHVYRGRRTMPPEDALNALSILEAPRPAPGADAGRDGQVKLYQWTLNIQGWPKEDRDNPSDPAYVMAAMVEKQLARTYALTDAVAETGEGGVPAYPDDYHLGFKQIASITVFDSLVLPAQQDLSAVAFFYIPITISFVKDAR